MIPDVNWRKLKIANQDGLYLSAMICESDRHAKTGCSKNDIMPLIVVCHGFTGSKEGSGRAVAMAEELSRLGYSALLFDFAGCGESEGKWEDITLSGQTGDLGSVVNWCRGENFNQIVLTGRSFGGTTALSYAAQDKEIRAVCTWAAVARPGKLFEKRSGETVTNGPDELVAIRGEEGVRYLKPNFFHDLRRYDLLQSAAALTPRSFLIIHGSVDESVPVEEAKILYNHAFEPKKLVIIEGADHRFSDHLKPVWNTFFQWLFTL